MSVADRVLELRSALKAAGADYLVVPSGDYHQSEYVGKHFKALEFVTGFSGSAGTAVVPANDGEAPLLWTDGRYFIQAEAQLAGSGIELIRMGQGGVPPIQDWLAQKLRAGSVVALDGRLVTAAWCEPLAKAAEEGGKGGRLLTPRDLVGDVWKDRPELLVEPLFELGPELVGEDAQSKLARIRQAMRNMGATHHLIATLDDIAWITNLRGRESGFSPLFLSFLMVGEDWANFYVDGRKLAPDIEASLRRQGFDIRPYEDIYPDLEKLESGHTVLLDSYSTSYGLDSRIGAPVKKIDGPSPSTMFKAIKNDVELRNIREAHVKEGVVQTRFMYWLKMNIGKTHIDEIQIAQKLLGLRKQQEDFLWESFEPICAYKENAAMMHYRAEADTAKEVRAEGLLLTDSGGNYMQGATDTTRTYALGDLSAELRLHFTTVVRSMLTLSRMRFLKGVRGVNLDSIARAPIWNIGIDYKSGTGHGVGYLTTIHEGPCRIQWQLPPGVRLQPPLEAGMVLTNEPGIYVEGSHGIRIENELVIVEDQANAHGEFLRFEPLTLTPIDLDAIEPDLLPQEERDALNSYHALVFEKISPHLPKDEEDWLQQYTRSI